MARGTVPYSEDAERAVLSAILLDNSCWGDVKCVVSADDFFLEKHRKIFSSINSLMETGSAVDVLLLGEHLQRIGELRSVGGSMGIVEISKSSATSKNVIHYADIVREKSCLRGLLVAAMKLTEKISDYETISEMYESIEGIVDAGKKIVGNRMPTNLFSLGDSVLELYRRVANGYQGIPFPWKSVTRMTSGMWPKTFTLFVGRPGTGKSMIATLLALNAYRNSIPSLIVSPEMSKEEIAERAFVNEAKVNFHQVVGGKLSEFELPKLEGTVNSLREESGVYIMDSNDDLSPEGIEAAIRACSPMLVAVDSIYSLKFRGDRKERVVSAIEWIVRTADRMNFAAVGFGQQNRDAEKTVKDGGGSRLGTIALADELAQDSDNVFALSQTKDERKDNRMKIKPLKLRRGYHIGDPVEVNWDWSVMNFEEIEPVVEDDGWEDSVPSQF